LGSLFLVMVMGWFLTYLYFYLLIYRPVDGTRMGVVGRLFFFFFVTGRRMADEKREETRDARAGEEREKRERREYAGGWLVSWLRGVVGEFIYPAQKKRRDDVSGYKLVKVNTIYQIPKLYT
jgi:hypothetical protein